MSQDNAMKGWFNKMASRRRRWVKCSVKRTHCAANHSSSCWQVLRAIMYSTLCTSFSPILWKPPTRFWTKFTQTFHQLSIGFSNRNSFNLRSAPTTTFSTSYGSRMWKVYQRIIQGLCFMLLGVPYLPWRCTLSLVGCEHCYIRVDCERLYWHWVEAGDEYSHWEPDDLCS